MLKGGYGISPHLKSELGNFRIMLLVRDKGLVLFSALASFLSSMTRFQTEMVGSGPVPFSCRVSSPGPLLRLFFPSLVPVAPRSFC